MTTLRAAISDSIGHMSPNQRFGAVAILLGAGAILYQRRQARHEAGKATALDKARIYSHKMSDPAPIGPMTSRRETDWRLQGAAKEEQPEAMLRPTHISERFPVGGPTEEILRLGALKKPRPPLFDNTTDEMRSPTPMNVGQKQEVKARDSNK